MRKIIVFSLFLAFHFSVKAQSSSEGIWINKEYYNFLIENKSPHKSHELMGGNYISHISIGDKKDLFLSMRFHDSIPLRLEGTQLLTKENKALFELSLKDDNLVIKNLVADRKTELIKVPGDIEQPWKAIQLFILPHTFVGSYIDQWTDKSLVFKTNGEVFGIDEFIEFEVGLDCAESVNYDFFNVYPYDKGTRFFGWELKGNRLIIFEFKGRMLKKEKKEIIYKLKRS